MNTVSYHSKLVGVSFEGRQEIISSLRGDEQLRFRREPDNEYDPNAVAVDVAAKNEDLYGKTGNDDSEIIDWAPIGYIAKDKNSEIAEVLDAGKTAFIKISEITGGDDKNYGVNVYVEYEKERKKTRSRDAILLKDIFGNEIFYDNTIHEYTNALGEVYLSGSKYAEQFEKPFDAQMISGKMVSKFDLEEADIKRIQDMWRLKSEASTSFGTAIHAALELYGRYKVLAESVKKETYLHDNPVLNKAVTSFYSKYPKLKGVYFECLVVDHLKKRAGRIDRLEVEKGGVYIADFKTNFDLKKSLKKYWLQLSFYAAILKANNVNVKGLKLYHYTGEEWIEFTHDVIDIGEEK